MKMILMDTYKAVVCEDNEQGELIITNEAKLLEDFKTRCNRNK